MLKKASNTDRKLVLSLLVLFIFVQVFGLYLGSKLIAEIPADQVATSAEYGGFVFLYIVFVTVLVLLVIKYWKKFLRFIEVISIFVCTWIFFQILLLGFVPSGNEALPALVFAAIITLSRIVWKNLFTQNIAILLSIVGAGAYIGASLGFIPALVLLGLLTLYDVIAVFKTKHMITMAKEITKQKLALTMAIPTKNHLFHLGSGDLVMPLVFSVAVLREFGAVTALATVTGSMVVLMLFFAWLLQKPGKAYPALPPATIGAITGWGFAVLAGVLF